ncbi:hypothetical protein [Streptomyces actuosus]|uniref:hypothetical protein n=1 Tax=Streptomyces actuosus TaxID=1885 RepID=UPI001F05306F|nr:hypothetical protein [Streptomyces actuosus]
MREKPDGGDEFAAAGAAEEAEARKRRIDLSVPRVAGSAVAAVVAAELASSFGVYGTILGAGVVSLVATCGEGSVFQHVFTRTGEQIRGTSGAAGVGERGPGAPGAYTGATEPRAPDAYGEATVHRARAGRRRRSVVAAAVVFAVTMSGITAYELLSGGRFSGGGGTTVSDALIGGKPSPSRSGDTPGTPDPSDPLRRSGSSAEPGGPDSGSSATRSPSSSPSSEPDGGSPSPDPAPPDAGDGGSAAGGGTPAPDPSGHSSSGGPAAAATPPAPGADSRSGTAAPDPAGPAGQ